jgi:predicted metal-binding membrane protein
MERLIETVVRRDRLAVSVALVGIAGVAWFYLIFETERFAATGICHCAAMAIGGPNLAPWAPQTLLPLFLMWIEMMVAMMLPARRTARSPFFEGCTFTRRAWPALRANSTLHLRIFRGLVSVYRFEWQHRGDLRGESPHLVAAILRCYSFVIS